MYPLGPRRTLIVLTGAYLGGFVASINQTVTATSLPQIVDDLGGLDHYSWVFTAYILASIVTIPLFGKLSDLYGRRLLFVCAIVLFAAGSLLAAAAPSMDLLVAGRALQGLGAGGLGPLGIAVMGDIIAPRARGRWQAVNGVVLATSAVGGPLLGGWITDNASWRLAFLVSLPLAAIATTVIWFGFGRSGRRERRTIDYPGALLLMLGAGSLLYAVSTGGDRGWGSAATIAPLLAGVLLLAAFARWERRAADPILPLALLRRRAIASGAVGLFAVGASMLGTVTFVPLFVQEVLQRSATSSGTVLIPLSLAWIGASILAGQVVSRSGRVRPVLLLGPPVAATGFALLATMGTDAGIGVAVRNVTIVGAGLGLMVQTLIVVVQNAAPRDQLGAVTASAEFSRWTGALFGVALMGAIVTARLGGAARDAPPAQLAAALHTAFALGVGLAALAFAAALLMPDTRLRARFEEAAPAAAR